MSCSKYHLNRKLVLESRIATPDGAGGQVIGWTPEGTLFADVKARSAKEPRIEGRDRSSVNYQIYVRFAPVGSPRRPRPDQRFTENGRIFSILAVAEADNDGRYLRIWAEEGNRA